MTVVDAAVSAMDSARSERLKRQRQRQRELGRELKRFYDSIVREQIPASLVNLFRETNGDHTSGGEKGGE